jgi:ribosomal protein L21E
MSLALKVNGGELFLVEGCGYLLAQRVKRANVLLETDQGKVTGALVVDYNNKIGLVGKDQNGTLKVLVREGIKWGNGILELRNGESDQVLLKVGTKGFESVLKEGKILEPTDQATQIVGKLVESVVKVGDKVRIRNNRFNQEVHKDLVGKIGRVQGERHESFGLLYDIAIDDTDQVYTLDWRDVEPSDVVKDPNKDQEEAPQSNPEPGQNSVENPMPSADLA